MPEDVALEGYFVLGERARTEEDRIHIKAALEKCFNVSSINVDQFYEHYFSQNLANVFLNQAQLPDSLKLNKIIWNKSDI